MLMLLPIVLALVAADPAPTPTTAPSAASSGDAAGGRPTPLQEIGRVRALPACVPIVAHANGAITSALENDRTLAILSTNLHNTNFDGLNSLQRHNAIEAMLKQASILRESARGADGEIKILREYAAASPDPARKLELRTFADALGGALYRQNKAALEFQRDMAIMQGREDAGEARAIMSRDNGIAGGGDTTFVGTHAGTALPGGAPDSYRKAMRGVGDALDDLTKGILFDEGTAADHSIAATSGC